MDLGNLKDVKRIVGVLSGKGGVGKSSVTVQLAVSLALRGYKVGVLDVDLCGPSLPRMFNLINEKIQQGPSGWIPVHVDSLKIMSIGFLLPSKDDAVVWRGPKKASIIKQFLWGVEWGHLDYLLVDTPPGTSDEHIALIEQLAPLLGSIPFAAVLVTTPQLVALADVEREIGFCRETKLPIIGLIENMSGMVCPHCSHCANIFSRGGGKQLAEKYGIALLAEVPIAPKFNRMVESDEAKLLKDYSETVPELALIFEDVTKRIDSYFKE